MLSLCNAQLLALINFDTWENAIALKISSIICRQMFIFLPHDLSVTWCEYDRPDYTALIYNNNNKVHHRHFCQRFRFLYLLLLYSSRQSECVFCVSNTFCFLIIHLFNFCAKFQNPNIQRGWKLFSVWAPQSTIAQIRVLRRTDQSTKDYLSTFLPGLQLQKTQM